jgi:acetyltransferase-like isoleucine patch superfamily enzyme
MADQDKNQKSKFIRSKLTAARKSPLQAYMDITIGIQSYFKLFLYELYTLLLLPMPGAAGFLLRKMACPWLIKSVGKNVIIGRNVVLRSPAKLEIGNNVTIDDNCIIEARGDGDQGVVIEDNVLINRNCMIQAKSGPIRIGKGTSIGSYTMVTSLEGVDFGEFVLTGGRCYFSAGAYGFDDLEKPIIEQGPYSKGPISIGSKSYFGAGAMVVGGIAVGTGAVVGAGSVVLKDVEDYAIMAGVPAKLLRYRK